MRYLALLLLLTACGGQPSPYAASPYGYAPTCHAPVVGGICTGPMF